MARMNILVSVLLCLSPDFACDIALNNSRANFIIIVWQRMNSLVIHIEALLMKASKRPGFVSLFVLYPNLKAKIHVD